ncbi:GTPase IMAP family member 9-like isoform X2 [Clupea harengus]|uniref:GTPase IMAP family member 9-like isoform X2 n=1 Tax=Clupea harengus TaxID=7950 RepID=A0A6P8F4E7_CLUHA|nr:GTPase IMAP family member 9-like isoform X2 [Clupea harengus]
MATGGSSTQDDQRVVLLGKIGAGKSSLANRILGREIFKTDEIGLCMRRQGEHAGRKLTVVDTPGWDRVSVQRTPERIKQEIIRSATLCLPGPHALLLVLPISMHDQIPSANEIKSASHHVALLSHRAWRHTIVLFVCKDEMDTSAIDQQVQGAKKLIDKCEGRYFILHNDSDVTALLQKIEDMVEENCGDFLIPQVSYEESEKRMQRIANQIGMHEKRVEELEQLYRGKCEKMELDFREQLGKLEQEINDYKSGGTMKRRSSSEFLPPNMAETSQGGAAVQHQDSVKEMVAENEAIHTMRRDEVMPILRYYSKRFGVVMMGFIGALVGSIVGATDGVQGSAVGVISGSTIGVLLAILYIRATRFGLGGGRVPFFVEGGNQTSIRSDSSCSSKSAEKCKKQ